MKLRTGRNLSTSRHGFSLAETAIAISVVSMVVLAMVGTMPSALNRLHRASARSADARALESIIGNYQMRDWNEVIAGENVVRSEVIFFDRTGTAVPESDPWAAFAAAVTIGRPPVLPGASEPNLNLRQLTLELSDRIHESDPFIEPKAVRKFTAMLSRIDR